MADVTCRAIIPDLRLLPFALALFGFATSWSLERAVAQVGGQGAETRTSQLVFEPVAGTGLDRILKERRATLEKRAGQPLRSHAWWLWGLSAFDYDLDGDLDFIVCIHGSTNGLIIRNQLKETGALTFIDVTKALGVDGFVPSTDNYPLVWDFDGDGYLDIAGLLDDRKTPCLLNRQGKRFEKAAFSLHPINYPDAIEDLNGDGYVDIQQSRRGKIVRFDYDAQSASFTKAEGPALPPGWMPADVQGEIHALRKVRENRFLKVTYLSADLDGDGRPERVVRAFAGYGGARLGWYLAAQEDGGVHRDRTQAMGLPREGAPLSLQDVDQDGDVDVLIASGAGAGLFLNDGRGRFTLRPGPLTDFIKQRCPYLHVVFSADLDNDGDLDLAVSNRRYGWQKVFENQGEGEFALAFESRGWDADPLVLRDVNDDGLVDLIIGGAGEKENIGVYLNKTPNAGRGCALRLRMPPPNVYAVGARAEVYRAGELGQPGARPLLSKKAPVDGSPIHVGLGKADRIDLRVSFPGEAAVELRGVKAEASLVVTPTGIAPLHER